MYKVFFNDRSIKLAGNLRDSMARNRGIFCPFLSTPELHRLIRLFAGMKGIHGLTVIHPDLSFLQFEFRSMFRPVKAGGGLVINNRGQFLMIFRNGLWDLPKGKLEQGEDFESAAVREVEEETGLAGLHLTAPLLSTYHTYGFPEQPVLKETRWFEMHYPGRGAPVLQTEEGITDFRWVSPGENGLTAGKTYGSIRDVLRMKNFHLS